MRTRNSLRTSAATFLMMLGLTACAGEVGHEGDGPEFEDDSEITIGGDNASDSGRSMFASEQPAIASAFDIWSYDTTPRIVGHEAQQIEMQMFTNRVSSNASFPTLTGKAIFNFNVAPASEIANSAAFVENRLLDATGVRWTFIDGFYRAEVDGNKITVEDGTHVHIEWNAEIRSRLPSLGNEFEVEADDQLPVGFQVRSSVSGQLWNTMTTPIERNALRPVVEVITEMKKGYGRFVSEEGISVYCAADKSLFGLLPYSRKRCSLTVIGHAVAGNPERTVVQRVVRGAAADRIFDAFEGDANERGFANENASLGCRRQAGQATMCIAQAAGPTSGFAF